LLYSFIVTPKRSIKIWFDLIYMHGIKIEAIFWMFGFILICLADKPTFSPPYSVYRSSIFHQKPIKTYCKIFTYVMALMSVSIDFLQLYFFSCINKFIIFIIHFHAHIYRNKLYTLTV
jgi:hypothetical protein